MPLAYNPFLNITSVSETFDIIPISVLTSNVSLTAASEGFLSDVDFYYSKPPLIITVSSLSGTEADLIKIMEILAHTSLLTGRAILPPLDVTVSLAWSEGFNTLHFWSVYRAEKLFHYPTLKLLEPRYIENAARFLNVESLKELTSKSINLRSITSYDMLIHRLFSTDYSNVKSVMLTDWHFNSNWRQWNLPRTLQSEEILEEDDLDGIGQKGEK